MIQVKRSLIAGAGRGAFATCDIPKNTVICEYQGTRIPTGSDYTNRDRSFRIGDGTTIVGTGPSSYINDGIDFRLLTFAETRELFVDRVFPRIFHTNCGFVLYQNNIFVIALRDISRGDELYAYYGYKYWRSRYANAGYLDPEYLTARL